MEWLRLKERVDLAPAAVEAEGGAGGEWRGGTVDSTFPSLVLKETRHLGLPGTMLLTREGGNKALFMAEAAFATSEAIGGKSEPS